MDDMVLQVDDLLVQGSDLTIFCDVDLADREARLADGGLDMSMLNNIHVHHLKGCTTSRKDLEALPLELFDSILILADEDLESSSEGSDMLHADSKSLVCLILIRDIQKCIQIAVDSMQGKLLRDIATIPVGVGSGGNKDTEGGDECSQYDNFTGISAPAGKIISGRKQKLADRRSIIQGLFQQSEGSDGQSSNPKLSKSNSGLELEKPVQHMLSPNLMRRIHETYYNFAISKIKQLEHDAPLSGSTPVGSPHIVESMKSSRRSSVQFVTPEHLNRPASAESFMHSTNTVSDAVEQADRTSSPVKNVFNQTNVGDTAPVVTLGCEVDEESTPPSTGQGTPRKLTISVDTGFDELESAGTASKPPLSSNAGMQKLNSVAVPVSIPWVEKQHTRRMSSFGPGEANAAIGEMKPAIQETRSPQMLLKTVDNFTSSKRAVTAHGGGPGFFKEIGRDHKTIENPFLKLKRSNTRKKSALISEILDSRTKNVINLAMQSDYVMSNELVSMVVAMVAEQREVNCILKELFSGKGNELHIHPADEYALVDSNLPFAEIMCIARRKRQIAIGYTVSILCLCLFYFTYI